MPGAVTPAVTPAPGSCLPLVSLCPPVPAVSFPPTRPESELSCLGARREWLLELACVGQPSSANLRRLRWPVAVGASVWRDGGGQVRAFCWQGPWRLAPWLRFLHVRIVDLGRAQPTSGIRPQRIGNTEKQPGSQQPASQHLASDRRDKRETPQHERGDGDERETRPRSRRHSIGDTGGQAEDTTRTRRHSIWNPNTKTGARRKTAKDTTPEPAAIVTASG